MPQLTSEKRQDLLEIMRMLIEIRNKIDQEVKIIRAMVLRNK
jgi:hypothetical protein